MGQFPEGILDGVDSIVHLSAISNDPIGKRFEKMNCDCKEKMMERYDKAKSSLLMGTR